MGWKVREVVEERFRFVENYNAETWTVAEVARIGAGYATEFVGPPLSRYKSEIKPVKSRRVPQVTTPARR